MIEPTEDAGEPHVQKIVAVPADEFARGRAHSAFLFVAIVILGIEAAIVLLSIGRVLNVASDTNHAVTRDVGRLEQEHADDLITIAAQKAVIDQAVAAILQECDLIEQLGGTCPRVVLKPPDEPTTTTTENSG